MNWYLCRKGLLSGPYTTQSVLMEIGAGKVLWTDPIWGYGVGSKKWIRVCDISAFRGAMPPLPNDKLIEDITGPEKSPSATFLEALEPLQIAFSQLVKKISDASAAKKAQFRERKNTQTTTRRSRTGVMRPPKDARGIKPQGFYLQSEGSEYGPLTLREAVLILQSGKLQGKVLARKEGTDRAVAVEDLPDLAVNAGLMKKIVQVKPQQAAGGSSNASTKNGKDKRTSRRAPLLAEAHFSSGDGSGDLSVYSGICRDISVRGMLILTTRCPTTPGVKVRLEVTPIKNQGLDSFVTMAEVVRILPEKNGFSVRFVKMPEATLVALTAYIAGKA